MIQFDINRYRATLRNDCLDQYMMQATHGMLLLYESALYDKRAFVRQDAVIHEMKLAYEGYNGGYNTAWLTYDDSIFATRDGFTPVPTKTKDSDFEPTKAPRYTAKDIAKINSRQTLLMYIYNTAITLFNAFHRPEPEYVVEDLTCRVHRIMVKGQPALKFSFRFVNFSDSPNKQDQKLEFETYYLI